MHSPEESLHPTAASTAVDDDCGGQTSSTTNTPTTTTAKATSTHAAKRTPRTIIRRRRHNSGGGAIPPLSSSSSSLRPQQQQHQLPAHIQNNTQLHHIISTTLPRDYEFEIPKTIWRIEKMNATSVALQLPEGLTMYASTIGDILIQFTYRFQQQQQPTTSTSSSTEEGRNNKPTRIQSLSILGDVTYGACCIDDLSARSLGCDLLVHYGHSCLVPLTCTVLPCLYIFVEIRVDVRHLVDCVKLTFWEEEEKRRRQKGLLLPSPGVGEEEHDSSRSSSSRNEYHGQYPSSSSRIIETLVMGTVQFRSAVIECAQRLNEESSSSSSSSSSSEGGSITFQAIVPQAKPLSPGEVLGCTAPSGLATLNFEEEAAQSSAKNSRRKQQRQMTTRQSTPTECSSAETTTTNSAASTAAEQLLVSSPPPLTEVNSNNPILPTRERVMIFIADGRFHLEAAMISNPTLRALRYDPYSKTLTEEKYDMMHMKKLRREAILSVRRIWGMSFRKDATMTYDDVAVSTHTMDVVSGRVADNNNYCASHNSDSIANSVLHQHRTSMYHPFSKMSLSSSSSSLDDSASPRTTKIFGIILGTLGRQGNPAILSRIRSLLHARGIRSITILLSEIFPKKLEMMSNTTNKTMLGGGGGGGGEDRGGVCAWVQIACPRLSIDWGHYFCVPVLSPYELFVAMGEVADSSMWKAIIEEEGREVGVVEDDTHGQNGQDRGYPMDFYSKSGGPWANYYESNSDRKVLSYGS